MCKTKQTRRDNNDSNNKQTRGKQCLGSYQRMISLATRARCIFASRKNIQFLFFLSMWGPQASSLQVAVGGGRIFFSVASNLWVCESAWTGQRGEYMGVCVYMSMVLIKQHVHKCHQLPPPRSSPARTHAVPASADALVQTWDWGRRGKLLREVVGLGLLGEGEVGIDLQHLPLGRQLHRLDRRSRRSRRSRSSPCQRRPLFPRRRRRRHRRRRRRLSRCPCGRRHSARAPWHPLD